MLYEGIANIELRNVETGEVQFYEEHNMLSCLFDDLFENGQLDGVIKVNDDKRNYLNTLICFDEVLNKSSNVIDDKINIVGIKKVDIEGKEYGTNGVEYVFNFGTEECNGNIKCLSLAHKDFQDYTITDNIRSNLVSGTAQYGINDVTGTTNIIDIDFDNGYFWSVEWDEPRSYKKGSPFYIYLKKFHHDFKRIALTKDDPFNAKVVESTQIDISNLLNDISSVNTSYSFLNFAYDEYKKRIYIIYNNKDLRLFNVCSINKEDTTDIKYFNMSVPTSLSLRQNYTNNTFNYMPVYNGRIAVMADISNDEGDFIKYIGFNPENTTDYEEYEIIYYGTRANDNSNRQLHGMKNGTCIAEHVMIKDNTAYVYTTTQYLPCGFFHKSKNIFVRTYYGYTYFDHWLNNCVVSTINELSRTLQKTNKHTLKITYRIIERGDGLYGI